MIPHALAWAVLAALAARRRCAGVAVALGVLAVLDAARRLHLAPRLDVALWCAWPGASAALSWWAWSANLRNCAISQVRSFAAVALAFVIFAAAVALAPWTWISSRLLYAAATWAPVYASPALSLVAWSGAAPDRAARGARWCAAVLALSGFVDLAFGAGAPGNPYGLAAPLTWATWVALGVVLLARPSVA